MNLQTNQTLSTKLFKLFSLLLIFIAIVSSELTTMTTDLQTYSNKLGIFSHNMYKQINELQPNQNVVFSPFSIQACAAMARLGATGDTAAELDHGLHLPSTNVNEISEIFHTVLSKYKNSSILKIANKIYVMKNYEIKKNFNELLTKNFYSTAEKVDFSASTAAANTINKWVESKTNNLIKDLIPASALDSFTRLVLINAIHFKGEWLNPFSKSKTATDRFYLNEVDSVNVPMMNLKARFRYADLPDLDAKALELPYKDSDLSMLILLPNSKTGLKNLEHELKKVSWADISEKLSYQQVVVKLPKFKAEFSIELSEAFKKLGMSRMFSDYAEFQEMLEGNEAVKVSKVIHKAFIDVNEEGTEAAAATAFIINRFSAPIPIDLNNEFIADRPFYYVIRTSKGLQLFVGHLLEIDNSELE